MKKLFIISIFLVFAVSTFAQNVKTAEAIKGTWEYTAITAPYEYQNGKVIFFKEKGDYKAKIDIEGFIIPLTDLVIEKSEISCSASIDYEIVTIKLVLKDGKLTGNVETYEGLIPVELEKV